MTQNNTLITLKKDIADKRLAPCYVFHGEESYLREYYTQQLIQCVYPTTEDAADLCVLREKFKADDLLDALESVSMLSEYKLVIVKDVDISKPDAKLKETIESLSVPDGVTLLFVYDTLPFSPDKRTKCYKHIDKLAVFVEFDKQNEVDLIPWLKRRFRALKKDISAEDARYLLFVCGASMTNLIGEVVKIASYASGDTVTRADIDAVASPVTETAVFAMTDELTAGRYDRASARLNELLQAKEEPVTLLALMAKQLRGLYAAKLAMAEGQSAQTVAAVMGYRSDYPARKLMDAARRLPLSWCREAVTLACQTDRQLKTSAVSKEEALPFLLARLAMNAHAAR